MQAVVNDLLINYERQGSGKKLILLHGWADSLKGMSILTSALSKNYDVINIDLPGFGGSQTPKTDWNLADFGHFLAQFIQKINLGDIYALIGHSNGGAVAIKAIAAGDITPHKLVLLSSAGIRSDKKSGLKAVRLATKAAKLASLPLPSATRKKLRHKLYDSLGSDLLTAENMSGSFKKVVAEDLSPAAAGLKLPTLLIYGEEDDQTPVMDGELYHQLIKGSTLEVITGAGHFIQKEKPELVVKSIKDFL